MPTNPTLQGITQARAQNSSFDPVQAYLASVEDWFPGEDLTQQFARDTINVLSDMGMVQLIDKENVGALIQTFAKGEAFNNAEQYKSDIMFHFTYERDPTAAALAGIRNPNAVQEINAVTGGIDNGYLFDPSAGRTLETTTGVVDPDAPVAEDDIDGIINDDILAEPAFAPGVLEGGRLIRIISETEGVDDYWIQVYTLPSGQEVFYTYESQEQVQTALGLEANATQWMPESQFLQRFNTSWFAAGEASEIIGAPGNFTRLYNLVASNALRGAGVFDPGLQGALLADPEIANIIITAAFDVNSTQAQIMADVRQTNYWRNVLYPGIDVFYNRNSANPEADWRRYESSISNGLRRLGYSADGAGSYKDHVASYLRAGVSADEFNTFLPIAVRVQNNPGLKAQLDAWAQHELGRPLDFNEFLDVLTGTHDAELDRIIESGTLAFAAERAGVDISVSDIRRIAEQTDLTEGQALQAFTAQEKAILAIGNQEMAGFGISKSDILDVAVGATPRSGKSAAEVQNLVSKLSFERGISDDPTARFFVGFNERGAPTRIGLRPLTGLAG